MSGDDVDRTAEAFSMADALGWEEFRSNGLLWLLNTSVLHPRGYALALVQLGGSFVGWTMLGDGSEPWTFIDGGADHEFAAVNRLLGPPS